MIFGRRGRQESNRLTWWRLGLLLLASSIWVAGASMGSDLLTGIAIGILLVAFVLGLARRRKTPDPE